MSERTNTSNSKTAYRKKSADDFFIGKTQQNPRNLRKSFYVSDYQRFLRSFKGQFSGLQNIFFLDLSKQFKALSDLGRLYSKFFNSFFTILAKYGKSSKKVFNFKFKPSDFSLDKELKEDLKEALDQPSHGELLFQKIFSFPFISQTIASVMGAPSDLYSQTKKSALLLKRTLNQSNDEFFGSTYLKAQDIRRKLNSSLGAEVFTDNDIFKSYTKTLDSGYTESQRHGIVELQSFFDKTGASFDVRDLLIRKIIYMYGSDKGVPLAKKVAGIYRDSIKSFSKDAIDMSQLYFGTFAAYLFDIDPTFLQRGMMAYTTYNRFGLQADRFLSFQRSLTAFSKGITISHRNMMRNDPGLYMLVSDIYGSVDAAAKDSPDQFSYHITDYMKVLAQQAPYILKARGFSDDDILHVLEQDLNSKPEEERVRDDQLLALKSTTDNLDKVNYGIQTYVSKAEQFTNSIFNSLSDSGYIPRFMELETLTGVNFAQNIIKLGSDILKLFLALAAGKLFSKASHFIGVVKNPIPDSYKGVTALAAIPGIPALFSSGYDMLNDNNLLIPDFLGEFTDKWVAFRSSYERDKLKAVQKQDSILKTLSGQFDEFKKFFNVSRSSNVSSVLGKEGSTWQKSDSSVSFVGLKDKTYSGLAVLSNWFYSKTGKALTVTSGTDSTGIHAAGERSHAAGVKLDVADDWFENSANRQEFIAFANAYGIRILDEYAHPSANSTGGHLDIDFTDFNADTSNTAFTSTANSDFRTDFPVAPPVHSYYDYEVVDNEDVVILTPDGLPTTTNYSYADLAQDISSAFKGVQIINNIKDMYGSYISLYEQQQQEESFTAENNQWYIAF
jgi:hypothetical protein